MKYKFRAWDKEKKYMIKNALVSFDGKVICVICNPEHEELTDKVELMQFTGLFDKNGKEIYEGDIVMINHPQDASGDFTNKPGIVFYWDEEGAFYHGHISVKNGSTRPPKRMWEHCEIIGNKFENPELLKE
jgi:uncharacterized phage protein (TIGR01671 family)